jgi:hypothetical protein
MFIVKTKDQSVYFTDNLEKTDSMYKFDTQTKKGKTQKHEIAISEISEVIEQEGTVEETYTKE